MMVQGPGSPAVAGTTRAAAGYTPGRGTVKSINVNDQKEYRIEIQHGPDAKPSKGNAPTRWPCSSSVYVTAAQAEQIKVGQEVRITVEPTSTGPTIR